MSLVVVGSMAFDAIETPFGKSDKIIGGAATYIAWCASNFTPVKQISVVGGDFPQSELDALTNRGVCTSPRLAIRAVITASCRGVASI